MNFVVVGCPFLDRTAVVTDDFLRRAELTKGTTTFTDKIEEVNASWELVDAVARTPLTSIGGSGANVAKVLAGSGLGNVSLCGKYGGEAEILERLEEINIRSFLATAPNMSTGTVNCFISENDRERTMHTSLGASASLTQEDIPSEPFAGARHVHIEGYAILAKGVMERVIALAKSAGATLSLDLASSWIAENYRGDLAKYIPEADFVFGNKDEMLAFTREVSLEAAFTHFGKEQTIIATQGADGCWVKAKGDTKAIHYPAAQVPNIVDTTGAGDYFCAAFLGYDGDVETCVQIGNLAATSVIQHYGAELSKEAWEKLRYDVASCLKEAAHVSAEKR